MFSDVADAPTAPVCDDITDTSVHLVWKPPDFDGGSNITNYVVQKRPAKPDEDEEVDEDWEDVFETPECQCSLFDLETGKEFEFRIRAVNEMGPGDPSDSSGKTLIELPKSKYQHVVKPQSSSRAVVKP